MVIYQLIGGDYTYDEYFGLIPPESKTFEFPLYITVPFVEENPISHMLIYQKYNDDICKQLYQYCLENAVLVKAADFLGGMELWEVQDVPDIYINGRKVYAINFDVAEGVVESGVLLDIGVYETSIAEDGTYYLYVYK